MIINDLHVRESVQELLDFPGLPVTCWRQIRIRNLDLIHTNPCWKVLKVTRWFFKSFDINFEPTKIQWLPQFNLSYLAPNLLPLLAKCENIIIMPSGRFSHAKKKRGNATSQKPKEAMGNKWGVRYSRRTEHYSVISCRKNITPPFINLHLNGQVSVYFVRICG